MDVQQIPLPSTDPGPPAQAATAAATVPSAQAREPTFLQVFTLVLWLTCLVVGLLGLWIEGRLAAPAASPPPKPEPPPMQAEVIDVELTKQPAVVADLDAPAPAPETTAQPPTPPADPPPLPAVAAPSPAIAFAVPVQGPVRIVEAARAAAAGPAQAPVVEHLVYGQGTTAAQPQPDYPDEAKFGHQEGVVGIQFTVGPGGRVADARVAQASPWPLLNQSALRTIRDQWANPRWAPGRIYIVSIRFQINRH